MGLLDDLKKQALTALGETSDASTTSQNKNDVNKVYDDELENFISLALEDGELTEKEKQVLFKKAQAKGIDLDEFEMYLDARLARVKPKNKQNSEVTSAPNSTRSTNVRKCPNCGSIVPAFALACPDCGYDMGGILSSNAAQDMFGKIKEIYDEAEQKKEVLRNDNKGFLGLDKRDLEHEFYQIDSQTKNKVKLFVQNFLIPTTKTDLFEFISSLSTHVMSESEDEEYEFMTLDDEQLRITYKRKYKEALNKAMTIFPNDPLFSKFLSEEQNRIETINKKEQDSKKKSKIRKWTIIVSLVLIILDRSCLGLSWGLILLLNILTPIVISKLLAVFIK